MSTTRRGRSRSRTSITTNSWRPSPTRSPTPAAPRRGSTLTLRERRFARRSLIGGNYAEDFRISARAAFIPLPMRPHPLFGSLADEGFELLLQRGGGDDGVGLAIVGLGNGYARAADDEMDIGAAERGAGVEGKAGGAGKQGREDGR